MTRVPLSQSTSPAAGASSRWTSGTKLPSPGMGSHTANRRVRHFYIHNGDDSGFIR